ncbi:hypothetical protein GEA64_03680 [Photorhabdus khanii]|uniref:Baseplate protein J-like domain-containing protein n=1 Tax=Photorhabdus khanii TaxID=1004150 RepID=A0A7C9KFV9_9GAMM|nr:hypothetical protein [Photorhabdus khanii]MQL47145.1 hypothetical protein [Photorhabdus khanii]
MGLTELENKLAAIVPDTDFKLDERSTLDILNWLKEYAEKIPFGQDKNKFWDSFYFIQENNPEKLADIYQNANKAKGFLPAHQAFVLAFLKLLETTKVLFNTFPARHRDLYYRELLGLKPRSAQADSVALGITLNTDNTEYLIPKGTLFDAGQDSAGNPLQYASDADLLANQGKLTDLRWYRKDNDGWQSAMPLNLSDNIKLPENGIKLFSPTSNDTPVSSGYLITSSLFAMSKGERSIKVTLENEWTGNPHHITAKISSGNDWLPLLVEKENNTHLKLCLSAKDAPISPPDNLDNMTFDLPVLKLSTTQGIILPKITGIEININGNHNVLYASDDGIEQTNATSFPFGQSPSSGSGFNLVAPEWYGSKEATLTLTLQWVGLPTENFKTWYDTYDPKPDNNDVFKVQGYLVTSQKTKDVLNGNEAQALFREDTKPQGKSLTFTLPAMDYSFADNPSPNDWPASIRIELSGQDFMHAQYLQNPTNKNQPYTPKISALHVEFKAKFETGQYTVYPLTPFGWSNTNAEMPSLISDTFYLGFTDVLPGQTLSLYWQLEGLKELPLSWSYLNKNNTWQPLTQPIHDRTRNLFDKGGWSALLPQDASNQASQMPAGRYWIKAQMAPQTNQVTLTDLRWYRKDDDGWKSATPLNLLGNIELPANGIQLFSPTDYDIPVLSIYPIASPLFANLTGKHLITLTLENSWDGEPKHITAKISSGDNWLPLSIKLINQTTIELELSSGDAPANSSDILQGLNFNVPVLKLGTTQGTTLPKITGIKIDDTTAETKQFAVHPLTYFIWDDTPRETRPLTNDTFYLGFTGVLPGQTLSLYWQLEGTKELALSWSYLNHLSTWQPLTKQVDDQTRNLYEWGAWSTKLPQDASNEAYKMPYGRYWLKAQIDQEKKQIKITPPNYPKIKGILYNATTATLINSETVEQDHLINKLAADSIKQPVNASVAISEVTQPWASWNGRPKETEQAFLTRIPARLSHRNRALSWNDIVTLLKENFVSLFDVKHPSVNELTKIPSPEKRLLIVIPDNRYRDNHDALRPELNPAQLTEMVEWIDRLSSLWTTIEIKNPTYIDVKVNYQVIFISGVNPDYGHHQLQQELRRKYMPWGENIAIGVTPGNRIDYYQLLATIQQSSLVERVTKLTLKKASQSESAVGESIDADDDEVLILVWNKNP